ncbi:disulfide bond formation protein B [Pseudochrobactrum sp. HB0163]|uniref:disulfide bond formation protein B n=1 Tax=Pseudochrobactrum sp. HB0163 TaxID=3450708 RepID=UPI003F6DE420
MPDSSCTSKTMSRQHLLISGFLAIAMAGVVGTALAFQYIGGYLPCKLCLEERIPYYTGIPLMLFGAILSALGKSEKLIRILLVVAGLLMAYGFMLSVYHAGVEWKFWAGPADCTTGAVAITTNAGNLLNELNAIRPAACDVAAGRFLGISFAGWNAVAALILAIIAFCGANCKSCRK